MILKQIKQYKAEFNYSYGGIGYTLWYLKEILSKKFIVKYGIALVKYEYENAEQYYLQQTKIEQSTDDAEPVKIKVVTQKNHVSKPNKLLLDLDDVIKGGEQ